MSIPCPSWLKDWFTCPKRLNECQGKVEELQEENEKLQKELNRWQPSFKVKAKATKDRQFIKDALKPLTDRGMVWLPLDGKYYIGSLADTKKIVNWDTVNTKKYRKTRFDCENFAFWIKARFDFAFGLNYMALVIDYSGKHSYNLFTASNGKVYLLEPQNDKIWSLEDHDYEQPYNLSSGFILL